MKQLQPHKIVADLPEMNAEELAALKKDLEVSGQIHDIVMLDGKILDGRHRYKLLLALGKTPRFTEFKKSWGDPWDWVISQMQHRNRTPTIKAVEAEQMIDRWPATRGDGKRADIISERFGVSRVNVERVRQIRTSSPDLYKLLHLGQINVNAAMSRFKHNQKRASVAKLHRAAPATMEHCELRLGDNVELMMLMPRMSVNTIFADSPYNNGWTYRNDPSKDTLSDEDFLATSEKWMAECARLLVLGGSLFVLIDDRYSDHFGILLRGLEPILVRRPTIVCWETFANYNSSESGLSQNARYLHWYTKGDAPLINTIEARVESERNKMGDSRAVDHGRMPPNVWPFTRITSQDKQRCPWLGTKGNAPQLPRELPERAILLTTNAGDTVLDPFNGNGITGIAALTNNRKYIGIDRDGKGLKQSRAWIESEVSRLRGEK